MSTAVVIALVFASATLTAVGVRADPAALHQHLEALHDAGLAR